MISLNLFSLTHQTSSSGSTAAKSSLKINVKRDDVSAATETNSKTNASVSSLSSRVQDMYDKISDTNGVSNIQLLDKLGGKEDLKVFQNYIERFSINDSGQLKSLSEYDVEGMVNTIAAKYASLSYQIENGEYSTAEKQEMQKRLDQQLEDGLETLGERFSGSASDLFSNLGLGESEQKRVSQSLTEYVKQYKDEFTEFLNSDEGEEFLKQAQADNPELLTDDVALTEAVLYNKAERLVEEEKAKEQDAKVQAAKDAAKAANGQDVTTTQKTDEEDEDTSSVQRNLFTLEDLSCLGDLQTSFNTFLNENLNKSEEEIGYQVGLTYVKGQEILKESGASEFMTKLYNSNFDNFLESKIKSLNSRLEDKQAAAEETSSSANANSYKRLDESVIKQTFNSVVNYYNTTGSALDAMVSGFEFAQSSFQTNQANNSSVIRYQVGSNFFNNFYNAQKGSGKGGSADMYSIGMSYYKRYTTAMQ